MESDYVYKAKDISENKWIYGNYVDQVCGCVPLIITHAWMQDNGNVEFDYAFVDSGTITKTKLYKPNYILKPTHLCPNEFSSQEFDEYEEVPHCPRCGMVLDGFEKPNFCSDCGLPLDWR